MAVLGLHRFEWAFSRCDRKGLLLVAVRGLLAEVASVVERGL